MMANRIQNTSWKRRRGRRGQIITVAALFFPVFLAFMGLSLDAGLLFHSKRRMQTAADAGAMGGSRELWRGNKTLVSSAALNDAGLNGFNDKNATIEVNNPPLSGSRKDNPNFVEVIISQKVPTFFMRIVGPQYETVKARGVAGLVADVDYCLMALDPGQRGSLTVQGTSRLTAGCNVMVNSNNSKAIVANGGACVYSSEIGVSGDYVEDGSANCLSPSPTRDVPPAMDPLAYHLAPVIPESALASDMKITGDSHTLSPGRYDRGITVTGGIVKFQAGVYILNGGGLQISGSPVVSGAGVMFYNTLLSSGKSGGSGGNWGTFNIAGSATVSFSAPSTGEYAGMLFWTDRSAPDRNPGNVINGSAQSTLEGALYFPSTSLSYSGTSDGAKWTMMVANTITISGDTKVGSKYSSSSVPPPTRQSTLVE